MTQTSRRRADRAPYTYRYTYSTRIVIVRGRSYRSVCPLRPYPNKSRTVRT